MGWITELARSDKEGLPLACLVAFAIPACAPKGMEDRVREEGLEIVYDADDRQEPYESTDSRHREFAKESLVALIPNEMVIRSGTAGFAEVDAPTLREAYNLCPSERFLNQPSAAACSGVLVAPTEVLTAAHCLKHGFGGDMSCDQYSYVFGYSYSDDGQLGTLDAADVFECRGFRLDERTPHELAMVNLARAADTQRKPLPLEPLTLRINDPMVVMGFPSGLPAKIDAGAQILSLDSDGHFTLNSDTFASSSGSAIFSSNGALAGVLLAGNTDYVQLEESCTNVRRVSTGDLQDHELAIRIEEAAVLLDDTRTQGEAEESSQVAQEQHVGAAACSVERRRQGSPASVLVWLLATLTRCIRSLRGSNTT